MAIQLISQLQPGGSSFNDTDLLVLENTGILEHRSYTFLDLQTQILSAIPPPAEGGVTYIGTPAADQITAWNSLGILRGEPGFKSLASGHIYIQNNLGIGTETPGASLEINKTASARINLVTSDSSGWIRMQNSAETEAPSSLYIGTDAAAPIHFNPGNTGSSGKIVMTSDGDVGIGTPTPASKLHIHRNNTTSTNNTNSRTYSTT